MSCASSSAVVQARYAAEVNGINRYRFFHRPMEISTSFLSIATANNNIDRSSSPSSGNLYLPRISPSISRRKTHNNYVNGRKTNNRKAAPKNVPKNCKLPQLHNQSLNSSLSITSAKISLLPRNHSLKSPAPANGNYLTHSTPPLMFHGAVPSRSVNSAPDALRAYPLFADSLPEIVRSASTDNMLKKKKHSKSVNSHSSSNRFRAKVDLPSPALLSTSTPSPKVPSIVDRDARLHWSHSTFSLNRSPPRALRDSSTQTEEVAYVVKTSSPADSLPNTECNGETSRIQRATQTDRIQYTETIPARKSIDHISIHELEERSELFKIIDSALDETIDRNSRMRTNKVIASTAKRQADIWRDAKEFVRKVLLPSSIALANQMGASRSPQASPLQRLIENWDQSF